MKRRKLLTVLLAVVLVLALLPAPALAASPSGVTPAAGACEIGTTRYDSLDAAVTAVATGQTIRLLENITTSVDIGVSGGARFTIDTNGKNLIFEANFYVDNGSDVTIDGNAGSDGDVDVCSLEDAKLTITGNFTSTNAGIYTAVLQCYDGGSLNVYGNITTTGIGILAGAGGTATVGGVITATGVNGVYCQYGSAVVGDIYVTGDDSYGVYSEGGTVTTGNVTLNGGGETSTGVYSAYGDVTVNGNVVAIGDLVTGVLSYGDSGFITVTGNVSVDGVLSTGVAADGYCEAYIKGNISAVGDESVGVHSRYGGKMKVDGTITAGGERILLNWETCEKDTIDSDFEGYDQYSGDGGANAWVWVKIYVPPVVVVTPPAVTPTLPAVTPPVTAPEPQPMASNPPKEKAKKPAVVKCKVIFDANGGKIGRAKSKSVKITKGKSLGKLPKVAKRSNYTFKGWYTSKTGGKKVTAGTKVTKSMTVYAHWQRKALYGKVVKTSALYVRIYPSLHVNLIPTIGYLKGGTVFRIAGFIDNPGTGNDWYKLKYKGKVRYLFAKYVKTFYK